MTNIFKIQDELVNRREDFVTITLVNVIGSAPQEIGAKAVVTNHGLFFGTVGGGKIEAYAINYALELLKIQNTKIAIKKLNLQTDIGMSCGGVVELIFESTLFRNDLKVAIFGAGHVALETIKLLSNLNSYIVNIESRVEWQNKVENKGNIKKILTEDMSSIIDQLDDDYYIVSLTMGHAFDRPILAKALKRRFKFIGVIGSEQKANSLKKELLLDGVSNNELENLVCPIGLNFGTNEPTEIAISIVSQLLMIRDKNKF